MLHPEGFILMNELDMTNVSMNNENMNEITRQLLELVSDYKGDFKGAFNIREDGKCAGRMSSKNIKIDSKTD